MAFVKVADIRDLPPGELIEFERGFESYAICNVDGEIRAVWGSCPHHGGPLGQGGLQGGMITCPWHMWPFDSATGECGLNPAVKIPVYKVRVVGDAVEVDL